MILRFLISGENEKEGGGIDRVEGSDVDSIAIDRIGQKSEVNLNAGPERTGRS